MNSLNSCNLLKKMMFKGLLLVLLNNRLCNFLKLHKKELTATHPRCLMASASSEVIFKNYQFKHEWVSSWRNTHKSKMRVETW